MGNLVNLRRVRKAKKRAEKEAAAAEHRVRFGRTRAERERAAAEAALAVRRLDGAKRAPEDDSGSGS
jgi:hypothetical protein